MNSFSIFEIASALELAKFLGLSVSSLYYTPKRPKIDQEVKLRIESVMADHSGHKNFFGHLKAEKGERLEELYRMIYYYNHRRIHTKLKMTPYVIKSQLSGEKRQIVKDLVEKIIIKKGGDEVETWIHIPLNQAHHMGYESNSRHSGFGECGEVHLV